MGGRCRACLATVSRIEVLGFPRWHLLDETRRARLELLVSALPELPLEERIVARAIELRRQKKMTLADSIIAATALLYRLPLITRNETDFTQIAGLEVINPIPSPDDQ